MSRGPRHQPPRPYAAGATASGISGLPWTRADDEIAPKTVTHDTPSRPAQFDPEEAIDKTVGVIPNSYGASLLRWVDER